MNGLELNGMSLHVASMMDLTWARDTSNSPSSTAASFIRATRAKDLEQSFVDAVREKYAAPLDAELYKPGQQIEISGKVVEEIGFDKIRQQQARLHELKIVLVDGMRIKEAQVPGGDIEQICPGIVELDLSRNLFEIFQPIADIIERLLNLRKLRLNGNRLQDLGDASSLVENVQKWRHVPFRNIRELELDNVLISWNAVKTLVAQFPLLLTLSVSSNYFSCLSCPLPDGITSLTLEYNEFTTIWDLIPLRQLKTLEVLHLKGNKISSVDKEGSRLSSLHVFGERLRYVDLSYNAVASWSFVDDLPQIFPGLQELRLSHNPIYRGVPKEIGTATSVDEGYMLTLARLGNLKSLNFSKITAADRTNAEVFYLSRIAKAMAELPESEEHTVTSQHKRYSELCEKYGEPAVVRKREGAVNPDFLDARLIKFSFYLPSNPQAGREEAITKSREIPTSFDVYRVKGIVGKLFDVAPLKIRLIWETGEWDPVAGYEDDEGDSDDEESTEVKVTEANGTGAQEKGRWMKREVEIEDGTRQVGFCVDGMEAKVRIEMR